MLNDFLLNIKDGEFVCVLGKSGCGKFILFNLIVGYLKLDYGNIFVNGLEVEGLLVERGVVF